MYFAYLQIPIFYSLISINGSRERGAARPWARVSLLVTFVNIQILNSKTHWLQLRVHDLSLNNGDLDSNTILFLNDSYNPVY
jgi:hypothetical protein